MLKNKPLDESRKTGQTSGTKIPFYSKKYNYYLNKYFKNYLICYSRRFGS
ncbi:hypothetical protein Hanom_Chr01g00089791 [Helianthus anomalus]